MSLPNTFGIPQDSAGWKAFRKEKEEEAKQFAWEKLYGFRE